MKLLVSTSDLANQTIFNDIRQIINASTQIYDLSSPELSLHSFEGKELLDKESSDKGGDFQPVCFLTR
jgi:hypothetical protein